MQPKAAIALWEQARHLDPVFATAHRNLGFAYAHTEHDTRKAAASLEKAVACDPNDPKLFAEFDELEESLNQDPRKRLDLLEKHHDAVVRRDDSLLREISLGVLLGRYDRAIDLLEHHHFRVWEGESGVHDLYADAHLLRGRKFLRSSQYAEARRDFEAALEYPDRFETSRPDRGGKPAEVCYMLGTVCEAEGQAEKAPQVLRASCGGRRRLVGGPLLPGPGASQAGAAGPGGSDLRRPDQPRSEPVAVGLRA